MVSVKSILRPFSTTVSQDDHAFSSDTLFAEHLNRLMKKDTENL